MVKSKPFECWSSCSKYRQPLVNKDPWPSRCGWTPAIPVPRRKASICQQIKLNQSPVECGYRNVIYVQFLRLLWTLLTKADHAANHFLRLDIYNRLFYFIESRFLHSIPTSRARYPGAYCSPSTCFFTLSKNNWVILFWKAEDTLDLMWRRWWCDWFRRCMPWYVRTN